MRKKDPPSTTHWLPALFGFALTFVVLTLVGWKWGASPENWMGQIPPVPSNDRYIISEAYSDKAPDQYSYYYNVNGCMDKARQADILIVGNSKPFFAFRNPEVRNFTQKTGLKVFNLSMQYGGSLNIAKPLIERFHLKPRILIVNEDHFFVPYLTPYDHETLTMGSWRAHFLVYELDAAWKFRAFYHHLFPRFSFGKLFGALPIVTYRSLQNGSLSMENFPQTLVPVAERRYSEEKLSPEELQNALNFKREMEEQGTQIILTSVPYGTDDLDHLEKWVKDPEKRAFIARAEEPYERIDGVARQLDLPFITPYPKGLFTFDGRHLDGLSAKKFNDLFFRLLSRTLHEKSLLSSQR